MKKLLLISALLIYGCSNEVPSDKLIEREDITYEVNSEQAFTGISIDYYPNGQVKARTIYKDGIKSGLYESFYNDGQLESKVMYKNGKKEGLMDWFHSNQLAKSPKYYIKKKAQNFEETILVGETLFTKEGDKTFEMTFYPESENKYEEFYKDGEYRPYLEKQYKKGKLVQETEHLRKNYNLESAFGVDLGPSKEYRTSFGENGKKTRMCQYNGASKSFCTTYCSDGREKEAIWYQDNGILISNSITKNTCY